VKTILKFVLDIGTTEIRLPVGAQILCIQTQRDAVCLWAICTRNGDEEIERRQFTIHGTGHPLPDNCGAYIATVQQEYFCWHVFETTDVET